MKDWVSSEGIGASVPPAAPRLPATQKRPEGILMDGCASGQAAIDEAATVSDGSTVRLEAERPLNARTQ